MGYDPHMTLATEQVRAMLQSRGRLPPPLRAKLSAPFLVSVPAEWRDSSHRVMIIGQETFGWWGNLDDCSDGDEFVQQLAAEYRAFDLAEDHSAGRSPFWRAHREMAGKLEDGIYRRVLWSNLVRVDCYDVRLQSGSMWKNLEWEDIHAIVEWQRDVLPQEIAEAAPRAIVFFTGPNYDFYLKETFDGIGFGQLFPDKAERAVARVRHPQLPWTTIRTYHPSYLRRSGQWELVSRIAELIRAEAA